MKKILSITIVFLLTVSLTGIAAAEPPEGNPAKFCKDGGTTIIENALEDALLAAHGVDVDLTCSQGACVSVVATHKNPNGVNTTALAVDFCKQVINMLTIEECVEHVAPALGGIFHPSS